MTLAPGTPRPAAGLWRAAACLAWLGGTAAQLQMAEALGRLASIAVFMAAILLAALAVPRCLASGQAPVRARAALVASFALAGFALASFHAAWRLADHLEASLEDVPIVIEARIAEMPQWREDGVRLVVDEVRRVDAQDARPVPTRLSLAWSRAQRDDPSVATGPPALAPGQRWRLPVALRRPHAPLNPDGFDAELWLFEQDLRATGRVRGAATPAGPDDGAWIERARQSIRDRLLLHGDDPAASGVLAALAVGDQSAVDTHGWELFRDTGVAHLMSISGLHITMLAALGGAGVAAAWRMSARALHLVPAPVVARVAGVAVAAGYSLLAGWGVPAQRTVAMLAAGAALRGAGLSWPPMLVTLAAAVVVTVLDPWALLQPGFWLSFAAVALLLLSDGGAPRDAAPETRDVEVRPQALARAAQAIARLAREGLRAQVAATLGLLPIALVAFGQVSVVGLVANLVAVPWVTAVVTPLALAGIAFPPLWTAAVWAVHPLMAVLQALDGLPAASVHVAGAPAWIAIAALVGAAAAMAPIPGRLRAAGALLVLPLLAPPRTRPPDGRFDLVAADVGQGTAVVVRTREHLLLFDTGPKFGEDSDAGLRLVLPLLQARGERRVDRLVLSHRDADHVGGAASILARLPVDAMVTSLEDTNPLRRAPGAPPHRRCEAGQSWTWDGVRFAMLHPFVEGYAARPPPKPNALSCVLRIEDAAGASVLLTGDIEAPQEAALVAREAASLRSDVLVVPHHGSHTSSSDAFLDAVRPRLAVIQVGYRSRYGHPHADVLARYAAHGIPVVRTDACGAWVRGIDGTGRGDDCTRVVRRRYWHGAGPPAAAAGPGSDVAKDASSP